MATSNISIAPFLFNDSWKCKDKPQLKAYVYIFLLVLLFAALSPATQHGTEERKCLNGNRVS